MNPFKLFSLSYLLDQQPGSSFLYFWPLLVLFIGVFAGSFKLKQGGLASRMREFSIVGLLLTFFRDQNIPYLGMRLWIVLLFVAASAYGVWFWKKTSKAEEMKPMLEDQKKTDKYLPKKKGKKKTKRV
ncbi:MAG: hypothetical protein WC777_04880 [Candidatus Gracilibacteria bacterium]|jgi:hypothetical protein